MKKLLSIFAACLILLAFGCSDDDDSVTNGDTPPVKYIIPLTDLNQWFGLRTEYDSSGTPSMPIPYTLLVEKDTAVQGQLWSVMQVTDFATIIYEDLYRNGATGEVWLIFDYTTTPSVSRLWAKYPAAVNDTYATGGSLEDTVTVTHTDTSIIAFEGTGMERTQSCYCYKIVHHDGNDLYEDYYYLSPDTGFVKWETYYQPSGQSLYLQYEWKLMSLILY